MSKQTYDKIAEGLTEALAIARGEKTPARVSGGLCSRELSLTDEQVAEVQRRRADPNAKRLTLDEFNERLHDLVGA